MAKKLAVSAVILTALASMFVFISDKTRREYDIKSGISL